MLLQGVLIEALADGNDLPAVQPGLVPHPLGYVGQAEEEAAVAPAEAPSGQRGRQGGQRTVLGLRPVPQVERRPVLGHLHRVDVPVGQR